MPSIKRDDRGTGLKNFGVVTRLMRIGKGGEKARSLETDCFSPRDRLLTNSHKHAGRMEYSSIIIGRNSTIVRKAPLSLSCRVISYNERTMSCGSIVNA